MSHTSNNFLSDSHVAWHSIRSVVTHLISLDRPQLSINKKARENLKKLTTSMRVPVCTLGNFLHFSFIAIKWEKILISCEKSEKWKIPIHTTHDVENWPPELFYCIFMWQFFLKVWNFGENLFSKFFNLEPSWLEVENISPDHFYCIFM